MSAERMVTRREAAKLTAFSYDTIRRRQDDGVYPNAVLDEHGTWLIPVSDLVAAGDLDPTSSHDASSSTVSGGSDVDARVAVLQAELERAQAELEFNRALLMQLASREVA